MQSDGELLTRVLERKEFFQGVFHDDHLEDWSLARSLGEFLTRIEPDSELLGHALQVRACRHLGDTKHAQDELIECNLRIAQRELKPWEVELILPLLKQEEELGKL